VGVRVVSQKPSEAMNMVLLTRRQDHGDGDANQVGYQLGVSEWPGCGSWEGGVLRARSRAFVVPADHSLESF
jgi:hypothetical protein